MLRLCYSFRCHQEGSLVEISRKSVPDQSAFISRMLACAANNGPNCMKSKGHECSFI